MSNILFQGVKIIDENSPSHGQTIDVSLESGVIAKIGENLSTAGYRADAIYNGHYLSPGWIDMRVHLTDPGFEYKEDLDTLAQAGAKGGFTSLVTLPNTHPIQDNHGQVKALLSRARDIGVRILPTGVLSEGLKGKDLANLYDMHLAGAIAFTDGKQSIHSAGLLLRSLQYLKTFSGLVMDSPLIDDLVPGAEVAEGIPSTRIGLKGLPVLAESLAVDRNLQVLDYFPGRLHLGPLTAQESVERIKRVKAKYPGLSAETSAQHLLANDTALETFDVNAKIWPPLRSESDRVALLEGVLDGTIDAISSNHYPQSIEEKKHDFVRAEVGASMVEIAFAVANTALSAYSSHEHALNRLVAAFSTGPARILQLADYTIKEGNQLDLTWFDPEVEYQIPPSDILSRGKNMPFVGVPLQGKALGTLCKGLWKKC